MFCPKCGANVENDTRFCSECGADVLASQAVTAGNVPPPQYAQNTYSAPPPPPPQRQYSYPQYPQPASQNNSPMSVGQYIITMIIFAIPLVGFIMMFVWSFGSSVNKNKKNFARATLILMAIVVVLYIILMIITGAALFSMFRSSGYSY